MFIYKSGRMFRNGIYIRDRFGIAYLPNTAASSLTLSKPGITGDRTKLFLPTALPWQISQIDPDPEINVHSVSVSFSGPMSGEISNILSIISPFIRISYVIEVKIQKDML